MASENQRQEPATERRVPAPRQQMPTSGVVPGVVLDRDVAVPMSDGVRLMVNVFRPESEGRLPVIVSVSPYGKDNLPFPWKSPNPSLAFGNVKVSDYAGFEAPDPAFWVPEGYVLIHGNVRGAWNSEGTERWLSPQDARDYAELIEWAAAQPFSDGNVGLCGVSYLAMSQWAVAALNPPHLKAIIPWEGASDQYREFVYQGGLRETKFFPSFYEYMVRPRQNPAYQASPDLVEESKQHPLNDDFWAAMRPNLSAITVPALVCTSWSDHGMHTRGSMEGFKQIASRYKWLYTHGRRKWETFYSDEAKAAQLQFFDHFLKGHDNGMPGVPRVRLEVRQTLGKYAVRHEPAWPVPGAVATVWYLDADGAALVREPQEKEASVTYRTSENGDASADRAEFSIRFDRDTELTGNIKLKLWVSPLHAPDADLFVGIRKFDATGAEVHFFGYQGASNDIVAKGWLRLSERELDPARSTPEQPWHAHHSMQKVSPGDIVAVEIEILPSSTLFEAGSSLRLDVEGRELIDYPGFGHDDTVNDGDHRIHTGGRYNSYLLVPQIAR
jgi:predicted acyl esterase